MSDDKVATVTRFVVFASSDALVSSGEREQRRVS
jgi:hypothetical protein